MQVKTQTDLAAKTPLDIEERLRNEATARMAAERASRLKDELLGVLAHKLRTPLSTMRTWAHLLKRHPGEHDQVLKGAGIIERNAELQAQILDELIDTSRILTGRVELDLQPVDLASLMQTACDAVRPLADSRGITVEASLETIDGEVRADAARLKQILARLLSNAVRFTPDGGRIAVSVARVNSRAEIAVTDTGAGIAPEDLQRIFEGLGLAIVRRLAEMQGGALGAASAGGASFTLELPVTPRTAASS